jgi:hypothetical protein
VPSDSGELRKGCTTEDCAAVAVVEAEIFDGMNGKGEWYPYCAECGDALMRVGDAIRPLERGREDYCMCTLNECPYADRGDFLVYRDEWERVHRELHAARAELSGRLRELEKLYEVLNKTRLDRDTALKALEEQRG